jgi:hypothetical protein
MIKGYWNVCPTSSGPLFYVSLPPSGADGDVKIPQPGRKMENLVVYLGATKQIEKRMQEAKNRRTPNGRDKEASAATEED